MEAAAKLMHEQSSGLGINDKRQFGTGRIICTQPRRISATSVAERVCYERNERLGDRVGYQIRFEALASDSTELLYCTTGILLRFLVGNPKLEGISCIILDEVHERSVHSDFALLVLKDLVLERKGTPEPLKIVLMSATIDASNFMKYFDPNSNVKFNNMSVETGNRNNATMGNRGETVASPFNLSFVEIEGRTNYPIAEYFIEDICAEVPSLVVSGPPPINNRNNGPSKEMRNPWATSNSVREKYRELGLKTKSDSNHVWKSLSNVLLRPFMLDCELVCQVVVHIENQEAAAPESNDDDALGSILIFVPGWQEITDVKKGLEKTLQDCRKWHGWAKDRSWDILPLHSMVPQAEQMRIFERPRSGRTRKIIVSTNIAETSVRKDWTKHTIRSIRASFCLTN